MDVMEAKNWLDRLLVRQGVIDEQTARGAAEIQGRSPGRKLRDILVQDLGVDHHAVFSLLARVYAFREIPLKSSEIDENRLEFVREALQGLSEEVRERALKKRVLPFQPLDKRQDRLVVVTPDPTDREVPEITKHFGYRRPEIFYGRLDVIQTLLHRACPPKNQFLEVVKESGDPVDLAEEDEGGPHEEDLDAEIHQSMLINLVEGCLVEAVRRGASDIHLMPTEGNRTEFHFRIDGKLQRWYVQESTRPEAVVAVVKDRAGGVDRFERDRAQDGFIQREIDGHLIRFRVSILPVAASHSSRKLESVVIRILDDRKVITDLARIGLQPAALRAFEAAIRKPQGMVILTGPTGSGKSTTLNAALHHVMDPSLCVITVEDPVEYLIPGARQVRIGHTLSFEAAVRSILRHDPDIVMVGEIRDLETAETAVKLANTGHLTFSTLHTNDAPSVVSRLYKMGVEPFLLAHTINIVVAQRLVPTLCEKCKQPAGRGEIEQEACLQAGMSVTRFEAAEFCKPIGCPACNETGYRGRTGIHEALLFTREIQRLVADSGGNVDEEAIRTLAISQGMATLRQSGLRLVASGRTSLEAILAETSPDV